MTEELQDLCFKAGIQGVHQHKVSDFATAQGEEVTADVLKGILKIRNHQKGNGIRVDSSAYLWKKKSVEYVKTKGNRRQKEKEEKARNRHTQEYYDTLKRGYQPTRDVVREQIIEVHNKGELFLEWHDQDMSFSEKVACERELIEPGLACVKVFVEMAKSEESQKSVAQPAGIAEILGVSNV